MRTRITALLAVLGLVLAAAAPASADTVRVGNLVAGELEGGTVVAGSPNLTVGAPTLGPGDDVAGAGNFATNTFAVGFNEAFEFNYGVAAAGSADFAFAQSDFLGNDFVFAASGSLSADNTE